MNTNKGVSAMTLQSSGAISLDQIRTEYGISGAVSMNQLYKGGTYVDSTKALTDALSSVSNTGYGFVGYGGAIYNYGDLSTATATGDARYHNQSNGYLYNNTTPSASVSNKNPTPSSNTCIIEGEMDTQDGSYTITVSATFARAGTYYVWAKEADGEGTIAVSGADSGNISTTSITAAATKYADIVVTSGDTVVLTCNSGAGNECIEYHYYISTKSESISKLIDVRTTVPTSGAITFSNFYGVENA